MSIQNSATSRRPALKSAMIRFTRCTLFSGWQFCTAVPMAPRVRGKIFSPFSWLK